MYNEYNIMNKNPNNPNKKNIWVKCPNNGLNYATDII